MMLDQAPCPVDECEKAYPHVLLRDKHLVSEHPERMNAVLEDDGIELN